MLTPKITKVLQKGTKASIDTLTRMHGRNCEIYYPKSTGIYSGSYNDVDWNTEPDDIQKLFIPNLFTRLTSETPLSQYDTFGSSSYYIIMHHEQSFPKLTKIVATSPTLGIVRLVVRDTQIVSTFEGNAFNRVELEPLFDSSQDHDLLSDLRLGSNDISQDVDTTVTDPVPKNDKYRFYIDSGKDDYYD